MANATAPTHYVPVTPEDHCAYLWITSIICLSYSFCALAGRFYAKWQTLGWDDGVMSMAQIIAVAQYIAFFYAIVHGLGKSSTITTLDQEREWSKALLGSQILLLISHTLAKCSLILFIRRLFTREFKICWLMSNVMLGVFVLWGLSSVIAVSAGCSPSHVVADTSSRICPHDVIRWRGVTITDVMTEVALVVIPIVYISLIRFSLCQKFLLILAFCFRTSVIVFSISFYLTYARAIGVNHAEGVSIVLPLVFQQIFLLASLFSATIPCFKVFICDTEKDNSLMQAPTPTETIDELHDLSRAERSNPFSHRIATIKHDLVLSTLSSMVGRDLSRTDSSSGAGSYSGYDESSRICSRSGSVRRNNGFRTSEEFDRLKMRPEPVKSTTTVCAGESFIADDDDLGSNMVIQKKMEWDVQSEEISPAK